MTIRNAPPPFAAAATTVVVNDQQQPQQPQQQPQRRSTMMRRSNNLAPLNPTLSEVLGGRHRPLLRPRTRRPRSTTMRRDDDDDDEDEDEDDTNVAALLNALRLDTTTVGQELYRRLDASPPPPPLLVPSHLHDRSNTSQHDDYTTTTTRRRQQMLQLLRRGTEPGDLLAFLLVDQGLSDESAAALAVTAARAAARGRGRGLVGNNAAVAATAVAVTGVPPLILAGLPREHLTERSSSLLKVATLCTWIDDNGGGDDEGESSRSNNNKKSIMELPVVPVEFGATCANIQNVRLRLVHNNNNNNNNAATAATGSDDEDVAGAIVLVMRRRDGGSGQRQQRVMARWAQQRGALGLVMVDYRRRVVAPLLWPGGFMTTSTTTGHGESNDDDNDITIPVVVVPRVTKFPHNGGDNCFYSNNNVNKNRMASLVLRENTDLICCVCTESFVNTTTIRLPRCHHRFHEVCAVAWLSVHDSCPYCRTAIHNAGVEQLLAT